MQEAVWNALTSRNVVMGSFALTVLAIVGLWLIDPDAFPIMGPTTVAETPGPTTAAAPPLSEAERIARLQRSLDSDRKYLERLNTQFNDPESEYKKAGKRFKAVDAEFQKARQAVQQLKDAGKANEALAQEESLKDLQTRWQQNRDRFDLAIKEHKELQENIAALTRKIQEDQRALDRMTGATPAATASTSPAPSSTPAAQATNDPAKPAQTPPSIPSPFSLPESPLSLTSSASTSTPAAPATQPADHVSREVERAKKEAKVKEEAAKKAENKAESITKRLETLQQNIADTKKLLETARQQADREQQTKNALDAELRQKAAAKAPEDELKKLSQRIEFAQHNFQDALAEARSATDRLNDLQNELNTLQAAQIAALREADAKKQEAETAEEKIAWLQNPFRPRNIVQWLLHHGPRLLLVALGMLLFSRLSRFLSRRLVVLLSRGDTAKRGTHQDRQNRAQTLVDVFSSALSLLILGGGTLMILDEVGIPVMPLMGGAAVIGLAVAFGAQNLIKDYFSGFMVLLEDQYGINDVVRIGPISGLVEHISLRTTVLRDLEGVVHFIPHGTITTVSNMTHGWSRALFDVGVAYKEDVDRVIQVLLDLGHEMRQDPAFGPLILDDPEMLGVDDLADSSVVIKFFLKTQPLQQWTVKREMLRRIKNRFDGLGIEIPFPHQTVYHRYETPPPGYAQQVPPYVPPPLKRAG